MTDMSSTLTNSDEATLPPSLDEICAEVLCLDPQLRGNSNTFKTAVVLLSALSVGQEEDALVCFTSYEREFISLIAGRMRTSGLWNDGNFVCNWADEATGEIAFWCDVLVAEGRASFSLATEQVLPADCNLPSEVVATQENHASRDDGSPLTRVAQSPAEVSPDE